MQFRRRDAHIRFGCISPRLVIRSSATRFTGLTSNSISNLSKRVGPRSLNVNYSCRAMRFSRPSSRSKTNLNGRANCLQSSLGSSTILCRAPLRLPRSRMGGAPRRPTAPTLRSATGRPRSYWRNQRYFQFCGLPLGQPLNRSFQSPPTRFVALRISDPVHVFLFMAVTEIFERLSRLYLFFAAPLLDRPARLSLVSRAVAD